MTVSNCCEAELKVVGSDEGTNYHVCTKCNKAYDTKPLQWYGKTNYTFEEFKRAADINDCKEPMVDALTTLRGIDMLIIKKPKQVE